jgi:hypothetical protein
MRLALYAGIPVLLARVQRLHVFARTQAIVSVAVLSCLSPSSALSPLRFRARRVVASAFLAGPVRGKFGRRISNCRLQLL